ncbi:hypothetical protein [Melioribacter sp. OK-6-Me]|uniref:hypothetical protein n=1 Tax=unclassified Melioribacter TaxID=2627329 RepID=UPI003ED8D6B4
MAKQQSFADKAKSKAKAAFVNVKVVSTVKSENGKYKFQERFVKLDDVNKVTSIK